MGIRSLNNNPQIFLDTFSRSGADAVTSAPPGAFSATGGTTFDSGGYRYHVFTGSGSFNVTSLGPSGIVSNLLVVAGGGYGGVSRAGGGGAGGVRNISNVPVTVQNYTITVGGGAGVPGTATPSSALTYSATGGGSMPADSNGPAQPGGSGAGGPGNAGAVGGSGNAGGFTPPEGNNGGTGSGAIGGGGGGSAAVGANAPGPYPNPGVQGGNGTLVPWVPTSYGENGYFAAGGSSVGYADITAPPGNTTGGGGGGNRAALANTGGGGGGYLPNAAGGSGVVILRYVYP